MNRVKRLFRKARRNLIAIWRQPIVAAAFLYRRVALRRVTFIAITGSVGKSTASDCLAAILSLVGPTVQTHGANGRRGLPEAILSTRGRHRFAVLEAGILQPGRMWRSALLIRPDAAVITAVNWQHARNFDSLERIATEKAKMLDGLPPGGLAVLNGDDPRVAAMGAGRDCRVVEFGLNGAAQVRGRVEASAWPERLALTVWDGEGERRIQTRLIGEHWAPSVLAAIATARGLGATWEQCAEGLARTPPHTGRLEPVTLPSGAVLLRDEYNGSWATLEKALDILEEAAAGRKVVILGNIQDAPHLGPGAPEEIGRRAARVADALLAWGRFAERYREAALAERPGLTAMAFRTQEQLAEYVGKIARAGDLILLKGYWSDHMTRIVYRQFGDVPCRRQYCEVATVCDRCPKLGFVPREDVGEDLLEQLPAYRAQQG